MPSLGRIVALGAVTCIPPGALAQEVRVTGSTVVQYVEMRPLRADSSSSPVHMAPATQDLTLSVWGVGRGVRGYARLRGRAVVAGEEDFWPQSGDPFDLMAAYVEISREAWRVSAGRQWKTSGLAYFNFDGASALFRTGGWSFEGYGGWSLARGENDPRAIGPLAPIEPVVPESREVLFGGDLSYQFDRGTTVGAFYQRQSGELGLYSERAGVDGTFRRGRVAANAAVEVDVALRQLNEARLRASFTLTPELILGLSARRHRPFFELWTIWGAFDPVGFDEYGGSITWRIPAWSSLLDLQAGRRGYDEPNASTVFGGARSTGWYVGASGSTRPAPSWLVQAGVGTDIGVGASRSDASLRVQRDFGNDAYGGLRLQAHQRLYEFHVREGTVLGVEGDVGVRLHPRVWLAGSMAVYRHDDAGDDPDPDWSQFRGSLRLDWTVGAEPASSIGTGIRR